MSSWLLPSIHYQVIYDGLLNRLADFADQDCSELKSKKNILQFVRRLAEMNAAGFNRRYGSRRAASKVSSVRKYKPSDAQLYKAIDCVIYQANEGNILKKYAKAVCACQLIRFVLSDSVYCKTPAYSKAQWVIDSADGGMHNDGGAPIEKL